MKTMATISCEVCGKVVEIKPNRIRTAKYCSRGCRVKKHKPHANTILALQQGYKQWRNRHPEEANQIAIGNLPKNCSGILNGNWKGGNAKIRQVFRSENAGKIVKFRKLILARDKCCRDCRSSQRLEVHHIIPISVLPDAAFVPMNAIVLCHECHKNTDSYCGKLRKVEHDEIGAHTIMATIPNHWQEYPTCGNYALTPTKVLLVFVSKMSDERSEIAVGIHELIEARIAMSEGIKFNDITLFDLLFEKERNEGKHDLFDEAGDDPRAPYFDAHQRATNVEADVCKALGLSWRQHDENVNTLFTDAD